MNIIKNGEILDVKGINRNLFLYLNNDIRECYEHESLYFADSIRFTSEKGADGFYHVVRYTDIYTNFAYKMEDYLKGIPPVKSSSSELLFRNILSFDKEKLLITVKCDNDYFEVICCHIGIDYNSEGSPIWRPVDCHFLSHKYKEVEMKELFKIALLNFSCVEESPISIYVRSVERFPPLNELISKRKVVPKKGAATTDYFCKYEEKMPNWALTPNSNKYICKVSEWNNTFNFEICKDDFPLKDYVTDRDGGWFVYLYKECIKSNKIFQTRFDAQSFLSKISMIPNPKFSFSGCSMLELPDSFHATIDFSCSVEELFLELGVDSFLVEKVDYRENIGLTDLTEYQNRK